MFPVCRFIRILLCSLSSCVKSFWYTVVLIFEHELWSAKVLLCCTIVENIRLYSAWGAQENAFFCDRLKLLFFAQWIMASPTAVRSSTCSHRRFSCCIFVTAIKWLGKLGRRKISWAMEGKKRILLGKAWTLYEG